MKIRIEPVTRENLAEVLKLEPAPGQEGYIETVAQCMKEAGEVSCWRPVCLIIDNITAGFAMYGLWADEPPAGRVWLDRFLIDKKYQRRGLARTCLPLLLARIRREYGCETIYLSVVPENTAAIHLYQELGFSFNGEIDPNGEAVMTSP